MKVVIIGSGNVATVLGFKIFEAGHEMVQVVSRHQEHAALLARRFKCGYASTFDLIDRNADLYIIAISDSALAEIDKNLFLEKKFVVHTAGSVSKNVLRNVTRNYGVFYPLQSLRKENENIQEIPILVDGNTQDNTTLIYDFAKTISDEVRIVGDEERAKLHVSAIIVNNFANHLYALTQDYCKQENIDFKLLLPLIHETAFRLRSYPAAEMQTGPAARNDQPTIEKHLALLKEYPSLKEIYELFTGSIQTVS